MTLRELVDSLVRKEKWVKKVERSSFVLTVPQEGGRHQEVVLSKFEDADAPHVRFTTIVGPADRLDPARCRSALEINAKLPHGCLAIEEGSLVLTATRPLATTTAVTSAAVVRTIARQADTYEKHIYGTDAH